MAKLFIIPTELLTSENYIDHQYYREYTFHNHFLLTIYSKAEIPFVYQHKYSNKIEYWFNGYINESYHCHIGRNFRPYPSPANISNWLKEQSEIYYQLRLQELL